MSVIIRLQNLPWAANAADIRAYFNGLSIPEGGVHIVGGEQGDAFIAFSTDEDARQAMLLDGGKLKEVKIKLFLSSRTEMLRVIEQARQQTLSVQSMINNVPPPAPIAPAAPSVVAAVVPSSPFDGKQDVQEEQKSPDDKVDRKDRYRSTSRERGRDRSRERARSRDRSRGSYRDRRGDRRRSRDRYRRRSRSRDRRRNSKDRDNKDSRNKKKEINKDQEIIDLSPKEDEVPNVLAPPPAAKVPILPDPPAVPPVLLQMPVTTTSASKDPTPAVPVMNFPTPNSDGPPFPYNPQMGAIPPQAFMQMRGAEGWNPAQMVAPMAMGMPRPMMPGMEMGIPPFPAPYGMPGMFPGTDPTMWRPPMMPSAALVPEQPKNDNEGGACIEIRGLPLTVSYGELKKWFEGLSISSDGIKMINDSHGNRTGITYIRFGNPGHKKAALNLDGTRYKGNVVEVLHLKDSIFQSAIDNFKPTPEEPRKFNPLDYKWTKNDRDRDTRDRDWERNERERRPEKERDHEREREKERDRERGERDRVRNLPRNGDPRMNAEPRGPETRPPSDPRPNTRFSSDPRATSEPRANNDARPSPRPQPTLITEPPPKKTDCIVIQGLPLDCHEKDVAVFFEDLDIEPVNIFFVLNQMGQPIGDAFCQFASFEEAEKASSKNNERMGNRPVSVLLIPKEEMDRVMNSQAPPIKPSRWGGPPRPVLPPMHKMGMGIGIGRGGYPPMGPPFRGRFHSGELGERFPSEEREGFPFERHMGDDRRFRGRMEDDGRPLRGRVERSWRPPMMRGMRGGRGRGGGFNSDPYLTRDGPPPLPHRERHREPSPFIDTPDGFGRPGCVVAMENVHFNADINEIIDFFEGFEVDHENVIRRFDESGRPTGDARVSLNSPSEAERAVEQLNFKMLRGRTVKVSLL